MEDKRLLSKSDTGVALTNQSSPRMMPHAMQRIVVSSPKGGVGKTTLTTGLAVLASLDGLRVTVVDLDPQGSLTWWYDARVQQARRQAGNDEASIEATVAMQHASGLLDDARDDDRQ